MQIDRAIHRARGAAILIKTKAEVMRLFDATAAEGLEGDAKAIEAVCDALEAERNRNAATKPVDFLADSGGDEREGVR